MNDFINLHADIVPPHPHFLKGANMTTFVFQSPIEKLQLICDMWLNQASQGTLYFEPLFPFANVIFAKYAGAGATTPPYSDYGYIPYHEVVISFFVGRYDLAGGEKKLLEVYNMADYCWVDADFTMLGGQIIFGMEKNMGTILFPDSPEKDYSLSSLSFKTYSASSVSVQNEVISISAGANAQVVSEFTSGLKAVEELGKALKGLPDCHINFSLLEELIVLLFKGEIPFVSLRQLRSISLPEKAAYQEIVTFNCKLQKFLSFRFLSNDFQMTLPPVATFPVGSDYGWGLQGNSPLLVAQAVMDFTFETGNVLWQSNN